MRIKLAAVCCGFAVAWAPDIAVRRLRERRSLYGGLAFGLTRER
jgi:hypothetical protein